MVSSDTEYFVQVSLLSLYILYSADSLSSSVFESSTASTRRNCVGFAILLFFLRRLSTQHPSRAQAGPQCVLHAAGHAGAAGAGAA